MTIKVKRLVRLPKIGLQVPLPKKVLKQGEMFSVTVYGILPRTIDGQLRGVVKPIPETVLVGDDTLTFAGDKPAGFVKKPAEVNIYVEDTINTNLKDEHPVIYEGEGTTILEFTYEATLSTRAKR